MLDIILMASSLLLLPTLTKMYWHMITLVMIMMSMKMLLMFNMFSLVNISNMFLMDQMSSTLIMLTIWISSLMMMSSYKIFITNNMAKAFSTTIITLMVILIICFSVSSVMMFYVSFEASLIPTMFLIMMWGYQPERMQASTYLMIYTITASLPLLMMIFKIYNDSKHLNMTMADQMFMLNPSTIFWLMMIGAFLVKLPLFSVHLWLPKAHVEAPVAGSMILAAILLKLGGYGLARMIMMFNFMNKMLLGPVMTIALIGGVITSMICLRQSDMKSLIAYSSVGHMGLMIAGMLSNSKLGMQASLSMMIAHGLSSSALFCMANISYKMTMTRSILLTKGMLTIIPNMSFWWFMFSCANMAAPPSINLMSEIFLIMATMSKSIFVILPLGLISFITVAYSLYLYTSTNHGPTMNMSSPITNLTMADTNLLMLHFIPIILVMLKPEMIISWC